VIFAWVLVSTATVLSLFSRKPSISAYNLWVASSIKFSKVHFFNTDILNEIGTMRPLGLHSPVQRGIRALVYGL
jgi:hypothetical protein